MPNTVDDCKVPFLFWMSTMSLTNQYAVSFFQFSTGFQACIERSILKQVLFSPLKNTRRSSYGVSWPHKGAGHLNLVYTDRTLSTSTKTMFVIPPDLPQWISEASHSMTQSLLLTEAAGSKMWRAGSQTLKKPQSFHNQWPYADKCAQAFHLWFVFLQRIG